MWRKDTVWWEFSKDSDQPAQLCFMVTWEYHEEPRIQDFYRQTVKTLIRLHRYPGWSESSLAACHKVNFLTWWLKIMFSKLWKYLFHYFRMCLKRISRMANSADLMQFDQGLHWWSGSALIAQAFLSKYATKNKKEKKKKKTQIQQGWSQLAFYVNLHRAVIGLSATLTGR